MKSVVFAEFENGKRELIYCRTNVKLLREAVDGDQEAITAFNNALGEDWTDVFSHLDVISDEDFEIMTILFLYNIGGVAQDV